MAYMTRGSTRTFLTLLRNSFWGLYPLLGYDTYSIEPQKGTTLEGPHTQVHDSGLRAQHHIKYGSMGPMYTREFRYIMGFGTLLS